MEDSILRDAKDSAFVLGQGGRMQSRWILVSRRSPPAHSTGPRQPTKLPAAAAQFVRPFRPGEWPEADGFPTSNLEVGFQDVRSLAAIGPAVVRLDRRLWEQTSNHPDR